MAKNTAAVLDEELEPTEAEVTPKQIINAGISTVIDSLGIDVQKNRYKAMRAIAFQAFLEAIEADDFDGLVERAVANADELPAGWEIERAEKEVEAKPVKVAKAPTAKAPVKKAPAKAPAAPATTKAPARRRPARA